MNNKISLIIGNHSDKGMVREVNQDSFGTCDAKWGTLFVVADGMGGYKGGEIASKVTVDHLCDSFKSKNIEQPLKFLTQSIIDADKKVKELAREDDELKGMGTTVVALIVKDGTAYYAHVGDSRIYLFRKKKPIQLTQDHSYVQQLVNEGTITSKEAEVHPMKNRILQAIGGTGKIKVDVDSRVMYKNDYFLLCTDGLSGEVSDLEMHELLNKKKPMDACKKLIELANKRGGPDNSTVILLSVDNGPQFPLNESSYIKNKSNSFRPLMIAFFTGIIMTLVILFILKDKEIDLPFKNLEQEDNSEPDDLKQSKEDKDEPSNNPLEVKETEPTIPSESEANKPIIDKKEVEEKPTKKKKDKISNAKQNNEKEALAELKSAVKNINGKKEIIPQAGLLDAIDTTKEKEHHTSKLILEPKTPPLDTNESDIELNPLKKTAKPDKDKK